MLRGVIFDMDGLMFDTEALNMRSWMEAGRKFGYDITEDMIHAHIGANLARTRELMAEHCGADFPFDDVRAERIRLSFDYISENGMPEKSGLNELLSWIDANGIKSAIATSSERSFVDYYLSHSTITHKFDAVVTGDMVKRSKPAPDIFLKAVEELNLTPADCVVLEDSHSGIRAAHASGARPIMVPDLLPPVPEIASLAYRVVNSLNDVIALLTELKDER